MKVWKPIRKAYLLEMKNKTLKPIIVTLLIFLLGSCAKNKQKNSVEYQYIKAFKNLESKYYVDAAEGFEKLIEDYPFSKWSIKGQVMAIYAYYKDENYIKMVSNIDNFVSMNPASEYNDYLIYMKGLSYFNQIPTIHRSQDISQKSYDIFLELINRYPQSIYSNDAKSKLSFINEHIVGGIMEKARFQAKENNYIGSINKFLYIIENYPQSNQVAEAYFRLVEIYLKLGVDYKADIFLEKLDKEHSGNFWNKIAKKLKKLS